MYIYEKNIFAKVILIVVLIIGFFAVYLSIREHNHIKTFLAVISFGVMIVGFPGVLQVKVIIDEHQIIQTFGNHPFFKPRIIKWEDVDCVIKDSLVGITFYRLLTEKDVKVKYINISMVTDTDLLLEEIVKRAKNAKIDSDIQMLLREKKNKSK